MKQANPNPASSHVTITPLLRPLGYEGVNRPALKDLSKRRPPDTTDGPRRVSCGPAVLGLRCDAAHASALRALEGARRRPALLVLDFS
jgi:hypothetical protein